MILRERVPLRLPRMGLLAVTLLALTAMPAWSRTGEKRAEPPPDLHARTLHAGGYPMAPYIPPGTGHSPFHEAPAVYVGPGPGPMMPPVPPLPADAAEVMKQFEQEQEQARLEMEARVAKRRQEVVEQLKALQDRYTKAGQLDEAVAVRDQVRLLQQAAATPAPAVEVLPDPGTLGGYRGRVGQVFTFDVVGSVEGPVWGTDVYTDDSRLAVAAVHAGVLQPGQRGLVRVTILPGQAAYAGSDRNGVRSSPYGQWSGSYQVAPADAPVAHAPVPPARGDEGRVADPAAAPLADPGTLVGYRVHAPGQVFTFEVVGSAEGTIWGTGVYTDDSPLATAAVHAGAVGVGERGVVRVTILPGQGRYEDSTSNGVTSRPYGQFSGSYTVEKIAPAALPAKDAAPPPLPPAPEALTPFEGG